MERSVNDTLVTLEALEALERELLAVESTPTFYRRVLEQALALVPGAALGSVLERQGDTFCRIASAGLERAAGSELRLAAEEILGALGERSEAVVIEAPPEEARRDAPRPEEAGARLVVPIVVADEVAAVMWLAGREGHAAFGDDARSVAEVLGRHIGVLLQRLRYQQRATAAQRELELQAELRGALARASEVDEVVALAVEGISKLLGGKPSAGFLVEGGDAVLQHHVGYGNATQRIALDRGVIGRVARHGRPVLIGDVASGPDSPWGSEPVRSMVSVPLFDGGVMGVLAVGSFEHDLGQRELARVRGVAEFVTVALQRADLLATLRANERRFRLLTEHMRELVCLVDVDGRLSYVSPSSRTLLGYAPAELLGRAPGEHVASEDRLHLEEVIRTALRAGEPTDPVTIRARHRDGHEVYLEITVAPIDAGGGAIDGVVSVARDVSERQAFEAQLLAKALYDDLTGLPNRALLLDRLHQACERQRRDGSSRCALLFVDLDRFKNVNDSLGHAAGDDLLRAIAERFAKLTRGSDTVARIGGDEFCLLLEDVADRDAALDAARRVRETLREPFVIHRRELYVSASIGIAMGDEALAHEAATDAEAMLRDADIAMYRAKQRGSADEVVFDVDMRAEVLRRLELESELHGALERGEFWLAYQPIVRLEDGGLEAFEALLRWDHPTRGLLQPDDFVPLAEDTGLIRPLDRWALHGACAQLAAWRASGRSGPRVSVNVSARHAAYGGLEALVYEALEGSELPPTALALEITESALMNGDRRVAEELGRLRSAGVRIQIDDFGTGYSSLGALRRLPIDALKVDRAFLGDVEHSASQQAIVAATVGLAHALGIPVVAEGVESEGQHAFVREIGCAMAQGFIIGPPMPPEALAETGWWTRFPSSPRRG